MRGFKFRLQGSNSDLGVPIQTGRFKFRLVSSNSDLEVFSDRSLNSLNVMLIHLKDVKRMFTRSKCDLKSKFAGIRTKLLNIYPLS